VAGGRDPHRVHAPRQPRRVRLLSMHDTMAGTCTCDRPDVPCVAASRSISCTDLTLMPTAPLLGECLVTMQQDIKRGMPECRYKAGALSYGMKLFGDTIDYVAVFDSDFQPSPSFLRDLIPYLVANPAVGWVQVSHHC
jgi:Glycosyl transferase family 2